jgi:hypothetical protein
LVSQCEGKIRIARPILFFCVAILAVASRSVAADRYVTASVDEAGKLRIVTSDDRTIVLSKEGEQAGFDGIKISQNRSSVGWVALYPFCCTSYPIPLKLEIYSGGKVRTFTGVGLPVWRWQFNANGKQVTFAQETVHGGLGVHYEIRNVANGRLIAQYDPPVGPDNRTVENPNVPQWVAEFNSSSATR